MRTVADIANDSTGLSDQAPMREGATFTDPRTGTIYIVRGGALVDSGNNANEYGPSAADSFLAEASRVASSPARALGFGGGPMSPQDQAAWEQAYGQNAGAQLAGGIVGALPGAVGGVLSGGGLWGTAAIEGLMGAAYNAEDPLTGALASAALVGTMGLGSKALPALGKKVSESVGNVAESYQIGRGRIPTSAIAGGGDGGILNATGQAGAPGAGRVMKGHLPSSFFDENQIPLMPSQRLALDATNEGQTLMAKQLRWTENMKGQGADVAMQQRQAFTNMVKNELGITGPEGLHPAVISDVLGEQGNIIGGLTKASGPIRVSDSGLASIDEVIAQADVNHGAALQKIRDNLSKSMERNGGAIDPQDFQNQLTRLNKMTAPGQDFAKSSDAGEILDVLHDALQSTLSPKQKEALRSARYKYKIAKTLNEGVAVGNDGMVNPRSFGSRWDKRMSQTLRGKDTLGQAADTFDSLNRLEAHTGNTLTRITAQAPAAVGRAALPSLLGGAGASLLYGITKE
jgi:hypothetical protein